MRMKYKDSEVRLFREVLLWKGGKKKRQNVCFFIVIISFSFPWARFVRYLRARKKQSKAAVHCSELKYRTTGAIWRSHLENQLRSCVSLYRDIVRMNWEHVGFHTFWLRQRECLFEIIRKLRTIESHNYRENEMRRKERGRGRSWQRWRRGGVGRGMPPSRLGMIDLLREKIPREGRASRLRNSSSIFGIAPEQVRRIRFVSPHETRFSSVEREESRFFRSAR